jgi:hypothetical protein
MKGLVQRRERIARVRRVQHLQAAAKASQAEGKLVSLETSAARLVELRQGLSLQVGTVSGATLQNTGELANRLDQARHGLTDAIVNARATAASAAAQRLEARIRQESAERLEEQALAAREDMRERRVQGMRGRKPKWGGDA